MAIPDGITRQHVQQAVKDFRSSVPHNFAESTKYDLLVNGERYPPKAITGLAAAYVLGRALQPSEFSGGLGSSCFRLLTRLGFEVVPKPGVLIAASLLVVGKTYTREDLYELLAVPENRRRGDWDTGYHRHEDEWFIFCGVGVAGRTGHDYQNYFEGRDLIWVGKGPSRFEQPAIQSLISGDLPVHVFFRTSDRDPFEYAGAARAASVAKEKAPVEVRWTFDEPSEVRPDRVSEEVQESQTYPEGAKQRITVNAYERNPAARRRCIDHHGTRCLVCSFDFHAAYGDLGEGFIHVHHLKPLSEIGERYLLDPITDLVPLCPNCHAMIHARTPALSVDELKTIVRRSQRVG